MELSVRDRQPRADRQRGELIDRIAAGAPIGKLFIVEAFRYMRLPIAEYRLDHRTGIDPTAIDAHRAAEAAADILRLSPSHPSVRQYQTKDIILHRTS